MTYMQQIEKAASFYSDAEDHENFTYEERKVIFAATHDLMEEIAEEYGKTYKEVLADIRKQMKQAEEKALKARIKAFKKAVRKFEEGADIDVLYHEAWQLAELL